MPPMSILVCPSGAADACEPREYFAYVGTYTDGMSKGIYAGHFSAHSGELGPVGLVADTANPSFLCVHPTCRFLYAAGEVKTYEGQPTGLVTAYAIDRHTGGLRFLNRVASCGAGPCHVATDKEGKIVIVANFAGGSVTALKIREDGSLGEVTALVRPPGPAADAPAQPRPHPHGTFVSADNRFVVVPDLGLDRIFVFRLDSDRGTLAPAEPPFVNLEPGAGPRHFVFHPLGRLGYSIDENRSTVTVFHYRPDDGSLCRFGVFSTLPRGCQGPSTSAGIEIEASGRFLYASNRGADNIAVFRISADGLLEPVEHVPAGGRTPRHFVIDPGGRYLLAANQDSGNIVVFSIDGVTGRLAATGRQLEISRPACVVLAPMEF